ncbi:MAG: cell division protein FtsA [Fibrobacterota bacterium]
MEEFIVGLDIGTTKIGVVIGEVNEEGRLNVVGTGVSPSEGLSKGVVVNIAQTVQSIRKAVEEAELMAGVEINSVFVGVAGEHIMSMSAKGDVAIEGDEKEVTRKDISAVLKHAQALCLPPDREIIHCIPGYYSIDGQEGIKEPIGMSGVKLGAEVHLVHGASASIRNIYKSVEKAGLEIEEIVLESLASSYSVLKPDEKELGTALVDIGGGTTDIAIFYENNIYHTAVVPFGGEYVTKDISHGIRAPYTDAENIKRRHGVALSSLVDQNEFIEVPGIGGRASREESKKKLAGIIEARMEEIFELSKKEIEKSQYSDTLTAGIVLSGGGIMMEGTAELAEKVFGREVRIGKPQGFSGLSEEAGSPVFATGVGLVMYGLEKVIEDEEEEPETGGGGFGGYVKGLFGGLKNFNIKEYF